MVELLNNVLKATIKELTTLWEIHGSNAHFSHTVEKETKKKMLILYYLENHSKQGKMKKRPKVRVSKGKEKKKDCWTEFLGEEHSLAF